MRTTRTQNTAAQLDIDFWGAWFFGVMHNGAQTNEDLDDSMSMFIGGGEI